MSRKVHNHSEQFDGALHATCQHAGNNPTVVTSDEFAATHTARRCWWCERDEFPNGQPDWHYNHAVKALTRKEKQ